MDGLDYVAIDKPPRVEEDLPAIYGCQSEGWVAAVPIIEYVLGECDCVCRVHADTIPRRLKVKAKHAFSGTQFIGFRIKDLEEVFATFRLEMERRPYSGARLARAADYLADWLLDRDKGDLVFRTKCQIDYDTVALQRQNDPDAYYAHKRAKDTKYRERKKAQKRLVQERREEECLSEKNPRS